jgi:hypothetical protein
MADPNAGRPLAAKLGITAGSRLGLLGAPHEWSIPELPSGVEVRRSLAPDLPVAVVFVTSRLQLAAQVASIPSRLGPATALWVAWPRRAGGHTSDLTDNLVRALLLPTGLVDVKVASLDRDWSALKFVRRQKRRRAAEEAEPPD